MKALDVPVPCKMCNTKFVRSSPHHQYCTQKCANLARSKRPRKGELPWKLCLLCETPFEQKQTKQKFCKPKCRNRYRWVKEKKQLEEKRAALQVLRHPKLAARLQYLLECEKKKIRPTPLKWELEL